MKTGILLTILIFLSSHQVYAQGWVRDSLIKLEAKTPENSYEEVDILLAHARLFGFNGDDKSAMEVCQRAIDIAKKNDDKAGEARALIYKSMALTRYENPDFGIKVLEKGIKLSQEIGARNVEIFGLYNYAEHFLYYKNNRKRTLEILGEAVSKLDETVNHKNKGNVYKVLGLCHDDFGELEKGLEAYKKALYCFEAVGENPFINPVLKRPNADEIDGGLYNQGQILVYLGRASLKRGETKRAKEYLLRAEELYEKVDASSNVAWCYEYLSRVAEYEGDYDEVIQYLQKALVIYQETVEPRYESDVLKSFGSIYQKLDDIEQAKVFYQKAIDIDESLLDTLSMLKSYMNIGSINIAEKKPNEAMSYLKKALSFAVTIQDSLSLPLVYQYLGQGWDLKNEPDSAISYYKKSIPIFAAQKNYSDVLRVKLGLAKVFHRYEEQDSALYYAFQAEGQLAQHGGLEEHEGIHELLSKIYASKGDFEKAYEYQQLFFTYHDSLYTENTQQIAKAERVRQNIDDYKAQQEAATLKAQLLASQNNLYLALAIGLLSLLALGVYLFLQLRKNKIVLEQKNEQLANLNSTKDKFFGIIAHDIRSPITALDSVGEQMDYYLLKNNEQKLRRLAKRVDATAKHLTSLLDNLLNWALLQTGMIPYHPKAINLKTVVDEVAELYQPLAETKNILLSNDVFDGVKVFADASALNTIIRNLVNNALKFTSKGGQVRISSKEQNNKVYIVINDTGTGIHAEKLERLFTVDKKSTSGTAGEKGSGLGLMLCKELVELNKGTIEVMSELGKGSTFTFSVLKG